MAHIIGPELIKYACTCGLLKPISQLYFCRHCLELRCGFCVCHEVIICFVLFSTVLTHFHLLSYELYQNEFLTGTLISSTPVDVTPKIDKRRHFGNDFSVPIENTESQLLIGSDKFCLEETKIELRLYLLTLSFVGKPSSAT